METELSANHRFIVATVVEVAFAAAVKLSPRVKTLFTATAARLAASGFSGIMITTPTFYLRVYFLVRVIKVVPS